jgi:transmembrane 9 superfamily member 1
MMAIFLFVHFPLTVVGAIVGRNITEEYKPPCRTNKVPREVPAVNAWYRHPIAQLFMAGFLPFSAIYIELHYIFASIWGHKIYTLFGILFLAFIMLVIVTSCITIALLYFQLAREDHRWWWTVLLNGGATGFFIFGYSFFYFFHRSQMNGWLQLSFYFGYTAITSYAFFIMLGFVGFISSFTFVDYIYDAVKVD